MAYRKVNWDKIYKIAPPDAPENFLHEIVVMVITKPEQKIIARAKPGDIGVYSERACRFFLDVYEDRLAYEGISAVNDLLSESNWARICLSIGHLMCIFGDSFNHLAECYPWTMSMIDFHHFGIGPEFVGHWGWTYHTSEAKYIGLHALVTHYDKDKVVFHAMSGLGIDMQRQGEYTPDMVWTYQFNDRLEEYCIGELDKQEQRAKYDSEISNIVTIGYISSIASTLLYIYGWPLNSIAERWPTIIRLGDCVGGEE